MKRDLRAAHARANPASPGTDSPRSPLSLGSTLAIHHAIHSGSDVRGVVDTVLHFVHRVHPCDAATLCVVGATHEHEFELFCGGCDTHGSDAARVRLSSEERSSYLGECQPSSLPLGGDLAELPAFARPLLESGMHSAVVLPLIARGKLAGILTLGLRDPSEFDSECSESLVGLSNATAIALDNARMAERSELLANFDSLTGLINRRIFFDRLDQVVAAAERGEHMAAVCFIDLDNFKRVNDTVGHMGGDRVLRQISQRLVSCLRQGDSVCRLPPEESLGDETGSEARAENESNGSEAEDGRAISRLGGDEFAVVLSKISHARDAAFVASRVASIFDAPYMIDGHETFLSASIGIAVYPLDGGDTGTLLRNADTAMYCAKKRGKNGFQYYTKSMNAEASRRLHIETRLRSALERNEFTVYYQQQRDAFSGRLVGAEALVRWDDPEMGLVSPAEFIPLAEETGCIMPLGEWVLRSACSQLREWQSLGYDDLRLAVNLSAQQLHQPDFLAIVESILSETGIGTGQLELEITETTLMEEDGSTLQNLEGLHEMGIELALDDFGTGYSSLSYLRRLSLDIVKIDRSFVSQLPGSQEDRAVTEAIIAMAHSLKLRVVAEGVETEEQVAYLREIGCDVLQGFLFGRPVPAEEFERLLVKKAEGDS